MWPFRKSKQTKPLPAVRCGEITAIWNEFWPAWEFVFDGCDHRLTETAELDVALFERLGEISSWRDRLAEDIDREISNNLKGWCDWTGEKELVAVELGEFTSRGIVEFTYAGDDTWGDLQVDVLVTNGKVTGVVAGD